jgi:UDP-GlcNAc3NAcA epimerase
MKLVTIVGARPQFVKAAAVSRALAGQPDLKEVIVHTGQHYDSNMSAIFFEEMAIPAPHYNLGVGGGTHGAMTGRQLEKIEEVLLKEHPDLVLVYGDTNSTLAGALAASKLRIPVAHVEAGLRSFNRRMPEEINRIATDHMSTLLFAPTETASRNLFAEGIARESIFMIGDVMYDAALFYKRRARKPTWFDGLSLSHEEFIVCTIHRAENTDDPKLLAKIMRGLAESGLEIVFPLHPRTLARLTEFEIVRAPNIHFVEPAGYLEMVWLEIHCRSIVTDSGGVQKEAYFHGKPCVTLRSETEWVELVEQGCNRLVGTDSQRIADALVSFRPRVPAGDLYGCGDSSEKAVRLISKHLNDVKARNLTVKLN